MDTITQQLTSAGSWKCHYVTYVDLKGSEVVLTVSPMFERRIYVGSLFLFLFTSRQNICTVEKAEFNILTSK